MRKRILTVIYLFLLVSLWAGSAAAQSSKGGGGRKQTETQAEFLFPFDSNYLGLDGLTWALLTGDGVERVDGASLFQNRSETYPGVVAYFMGSGNPKLTVDDPERNLWIRFEDNTPGSCNVAGQTFYANGDSLWFSQLANQPDWRDGSGGVDPNYQTIDGRFLGMTADIKVGYSEMILRFILPNDSGKEILWKVVFGDGPNDPDDGRTPVRVSVTSRDSSKNPIAWHIEGLDPIDGITTGGNSVARVTSRNIKGKTVGQDHGLCQTFIDFNLQVAQ